MDIGTRTKIDETIAKTRNKPIGNNNGIPKNEVVKGMLNKPKSP